MQDTGSGTRWLDAELLDWINDAQREIVLLKPSANSIVENLVLAVSETKQSLPTGGLVLLDVVRNSGGRAVRRVDKTILDNESPDWHAATGAATVQHYVYDENTPKTFWVYPPQPSSNPGTVQIIYSKTPDNLSSLANNLSLDDVYAGPVLDFVLYRAYSKDIDFANNMQRAQMHYQAFGLSVGAKLQLELGSSPNNKTRLSGGRN